MGDMPKPQQCDGNDPRAWKSLDRHTHEFVADIHIPQNPSKSIHSGIRESVGLWKCVIIWTTRRNV